MKKAFALFYFLLGGSLIVFVLSLLGCDAKDYKFIYKMGKAACFRQDVYSGMVEIADVAAFDSLFVIEQFDNQILTSDNLHLRSNALYAYEPGDPNYIPVEKLTDIKIYTVNDYNAQYPAGSDITAICKFLINNLLYTGYPPNDSSRAWALSQLNNTQVYNTAQRELGFILTESPTTSGLQRFAFEIRTEINELLRDTSKAIVIHP